MQTQLRYTAMSLLLSATASANELQRFIYETPISEQRQQIEQAIRAMNARTVDNERALSFHWIATQECLSDMEFKRTPPSTSLAAAIAGCISETEQRALRQ